MTITKSLNRFLSPLLDFIYPPVCISCNSLLPDNKQKVCSKCWNSIQPITIDLPLYQETKSKLTADGHVSDLVSCFVFEKEGPFQHIAHALKYQEFKSLGISLGERIGRVMQEWNMEVDILIPIPLHKIKQRERGYNQSELIAQGISGVINKPVAGNIVQRIRHTQTQTKLTIEERYKNVEGAFKINSENSEHIFDKICLLVDDVITSGATTNSCAKELITAGTRKVIAASAALAQKDAGV